MKLHPITIDQREKDPDAETQARGVAAEGGAANVGLNEVGDYVWVAEPDQEGEEWASWIGERKSVKDLLASVPPASDRLQRFFDNTGGFNPPSNVHRFLLLEGDQFRFMNWGEREWTPESLDNLLLGIQEKGIAVVRSRGPAETPRRLVSLWKRSGRKDRGETLLRPAPPKASDTFVYPEVRQAVGMLMSLPGVGEDRAIALLRTFKTLDGVLGSGPDELQQAKGIGKVLAMKIRGFLGEEVSV